MKTLIKRIFSVHGERHIYALLFLSGNAQRATTLQTLVTKTRES